MKKLNSNDKLQAILFLLCLTLAAIDGWGYEVICTTSRGGCRIVGWSGTCSYCQAQGYGSVSCINYYVGQQVEVNGYDQCEVIEALGSCSRCRYTDDCSANKKVVVNCARRNHCTASDSTWLSTSIAACTGSNNYALVNTDSTCEHVGTCCPNDSIPSGNTCKWRCDSLYTVCTAKNGYLYAGVLQDTTISGADSIFTNKCYYNCSYAYNKDSTTSVTDGNTACSSPSTPIADCTRMPNDFSSVRTTYGDSVYSYDFLTPGSAAYIDSIVLTPCSRFMYRCTVNGKYKYWYSDADIPTGCTNIVKIK